MTNFDTTKKIVCVILAVLVIAGLLLAVLLLLPKFGDGDGGSGNDDPVKNSGELTTEGVASMILYQWKENAWYATDRNAADEDDWTYDDLKSALAAGGRWNWISVKPKSMRSFEGKKATKISFTVEADRDVTVIFAAKYNQDTSFDVFQTISLKAGVPQNITFDLGKDYVSKTSFQVEWHRTDDAYNVYGSNSAAFTAWSATVYKITNLKCYIEE